MATPNPTVIAARQSLAQGRPGAAHAALQRALQRNAGDAELNSAMAVVQVALGHQERALYFAQRAARARPSDPDLLAEFGAGAARAGWTAQTIQALESALAGEPAPMQTGLRVAVAAMLRGAGLFVEAAQRLEAVLEHAPGPALALRAIDDWINGGQGPEAAGLARRMSQRYPDDLELAGLRAYYANYIEGGDATDLHRHFGRMLQATVPSRSRIHAGSRDPARRIRVGLLSPDLRLSAVAFFIEPFFAHRDRQGFELFGYSLALKEDPVGARLRALADGWLHEARWTDEQIGAAVERDRIDVLVDLAGLTAHSRLGVMAMRPAPVSATYLGYPSTTGLEAIDWRIVDATTDPPGSEAQSVERLLRMDGCFVCYGPPEDAPAVVPRSPGPVTFGSFNNLLKFNAGVAGVWARVLGAVPGSRLLMKAPQLADPGARRRTADLLAREGADLSRVEIVPPTASTREHLRAYSAVDIALDTFPYCGTTTTCEALLMGVPVVTLRGSTHRSRVGASLLQAAGLTGLVTAGADQYVEVAARLAGEVAQRPDRRAALRGQLLASPLCDGPAWCRRFEGALRRAWASYCGGEAGAPGA